MRNGLTDSIWKEKLPPICPGCGYNLTGLESRRCPECGRPILWSELRTNARTVYHEMRQVEDVNDLLGVGLALGVAGLVLIVLFHLIAWGQSLARTVAFFFSLGSLGMGVQVFRVRRFPTWVEEHLTQRPNYMRAIATVLFAIVIMALAIFLPMR